MGISVDDFMKQEKVSGVKKMTSFETDIFKLLGAGFTYAQVVEFLAQNGVNVHAGEIFHFVNRKKRQALKELYLDGVYKSIPPSQTKDMPKLSKNETEAPSNPGALPKFDWQKQKALARETVKKSKENKDE